MKKLSEKNWNRKNDGLRRLAVFFGASVMILLFSLCAPPNAERFDMIGMELALVALAIFLWKFPVGIYLMTNLFTLSAAAGSILKWYDKFPGYDRVVHFISGVILGYIGVFLIHTICDRMQVRRVPLVTVLFSGMFSFFCAGFWEVIEFLTDCVMHMDVQHGNTDTMGDIVAGFLGGFLFQIGLTFVYRKYYTKERILQFLKGEAVTAPPKADGEPTPVSNGRAPAAHSSRL